LKMATYEFALPELGEGIESGDVVTLLVAVGDVVTQEQPLLELETDKAVIEVPAPVAGTVQTLHVQAGDKALVGQVIVTFDTEVSEPVAAAPTPPATPAVEEPPGVTPSPPGTAVPAAAPSSGNGAPSLSTPAAMPPPRDVTVSPPPAPARTTEGAQLTPSAQPPAAASPSVRRFAREIGVNIAEVEGSGPGGRVQADDVKRHARQFMTDTAGLQAVAHPAAVALPDFTRWGAVERHPMSAVRRKTAEHLTHSWSTIPHVTQHAKADITELEQLRKRYAPKAEALGGRLTMTAIIIKVVAAALKRFPQFNASVDMEQQEIIYKHYCHIGVAVDTDRGLLVPVIRDVDQKNILTLAVELTQLADDARQKKTTLDAMQGGTFTVTNLGGIGGTHFSPIINAPEVAILGVARGSTEPVYRQGAFEPRLMLPLGLSYDHRVIDGADGARFVCWIAEALEQPLLLALEG
jgi:pyruvate dehydrogenase E2 component (dihydrolipoamide acetyltransferase)